MNSKNKKPFCQEGKDALMKILRADPIVFDTLKKVIYVSFSEYALLCLALSALGAFISVLFGSSGVVGWTGWAVISASFVLIIAYGIVGRIRKRNFDRCIADINETLREDVIVQVHQNPVGGMYENDSYTVMRNKGNQTESLCSNLISVSNGALRLIGAICSSVCMFLLNPVASIPALALSFFRSRKIYRLRNRYDDAMDDLDLRTAEYKEKCDTLLISADMDPDDIALNRAKAVAAVDEAQTVCLSVRNRLFYHTRITAGIIVLLFGAVSIVIRNTGLVKWFSELLIVPSVLMLMLLLFFSSDYYGFKNALADSEWDAIDITTLQEDTIDE